MNDPISDPRLLVEVFDFALDSHFQAVFAGFLPITLLVCYQSIVVVWCGYWSGIATE
jgi:hypothetical protein